MRSESLRGTLEVSVDSISVLRPDATRGYDIDATLQRGFECEFDANDGRVPRGREAGRTKDGFRRRFAPEAMSCARRGATSSRMVEDDGEERLIASELARAICDKLEQNDADHGR